MKNCTPRPWLTYKRYNQMNIMRGHILLATVHGDSTIEPTEECAANAELIVKAVNSHDELIEELIGASGLLLAIAEKYPIVYESFKVEDRVDQIRKKILKAKASK